MMRIILLGAPGVGKGTQATLLSKALHIPKIATGDMLRAAVQAQSALGQEAKSFMDSGRLVPDDIIIRLAADRIMDSDCQQGFIFDGFPRTLAQAQALQQQQVAIDHVIEIQVADQEIIQRLSGRRIHLSSGRIYHVDFDPPKIAGKDDATGEDLIQREDDKEDTIRKRLQVYREQTQPLVEYYEHAPVSGGVAPKFHCVQGTGEVEEIQQRILALLS
jgi:adenylate kinase